MSVYLVGYVTVFVSELTRSVAFYRDILGIPPSYQDEKRGVALLETNGATLILQQIEPRAEQSEWVGQNTGISLTVADLDAQINILEQRGLRFMSEPKAMFWGKRVVSFYDPDKNILTLVG